VSTYTYGRWVGLAAQAGSVVVVSRISGTLYLEYSLVLAIVIGATGLAFGWERQAMLRRSDTQPPGENDLPTFGHLASFAVSGAISALACGLVVESATIEVRVSVFVLGASFALAQFSATRMQATMRPGRSVALDALRAAATPVVLLALWPVWEHLSLTSVIVVTAVANLAPSILLLRKSGSTAQFRLRSDLAFGLPIGVWLFLTAMIQYSDRWVLASRVGSHAAADYSVTSDLMFRGTSAIMAPLIIALHPLIMSAASRSDDAWTGLVLHGLRAQALLGGLALIFGIAFSRWGGLFLPTADTDLIVVLALIFAGALWQAVTLWHKKYEVTSRTTLMAIAMCVTLCLNVGANWLLAPALGARFVAVSSAVAPLLYAMILTFIARGSK
jgi:hypothetical protein